MELTGNVQGLIDLVGGGSEVDVTQVVSSGTKIATITVDGESIDLYAPEGGSEVEVTQVVSSGTKIATITVDGESTDLYAPSGGGGVDPIIYSTTERKVGKWNNDDLYQKSYFFAVTSADLTRILDPAFSSYTPRTFDIGLYNESDKVAARILAQYIYVYNYQGSLAIEGSLQRISRIDHAVVTVNYTK